MFRPGKFLGLESVQALIVVYRVRQYVPGLEMTPGLGMCPGLDSTFPRLGNRFQDWKSVQAWTNSQAWRHVQAWTYVQARK